VKKGELIATMGSSGRSTGPHVHFEVYKNGRTVDPASYIKRTSR
jgi:murein DD-endopeptidase MepM/ murein hydrolase activator NlpD